MWRSVRGPTSIRYLVIDRNRQYRCGFPAVRGVAVMIAIDFDQAAVRPAHATLDNIPEFPAARDDDVGDDVDLVASHQCGLDARWCWCYASHRKPPALGHLTRVAVPLEREILAMNRYSAEILDAQGRRRRRVIPLDVAMKAHIADRQPLHGASEDRHDVRPRRVLGVRPRARKLV